MLLFCKDVEPLFFRQDWFFTEEWDEWFIVTDRFIVDIDWFNVDNAWFYDYDWLIGMVVLIGESGKKVTASAVMHNYFRMQVMRNDYLTIKQRVLTDAGLLISFLMIRQAQFSHVKFLYSEALSAPLVL